MFAIPWYSEGKKITEDTYPSLQEMKLFEIFFSFTFDCIKLRKVKEKYNSQKTFE